MKIYAFMKWQYAKLQTWQKSYLVGAMLVGSGMGISTPTGVYVSAIGTSILLFWVIKWAIWDSLKTSYSKFNEEQNALFTAIKESDKCK